MTYDDQRDGEVVPMHRFAVGIFATGLGRVFTIGVQEENAVAAQRVAECGLKDGETIEYVTLVG